MEIDRNTYENAIAGQGQNPEEVIDLIETALGDGKHVIVVDDDGSRHGARRDPANIGRGKYILTPIGA